MSMRCRSNAAPRHLRRGRILRVVRAAPSLSVSQVAAYVGCEPHEVHRCLVQAGFATGTSVRQVVQMAENPLCTSQQLERFSMSLGPSARSTVARHRNCSPANACGAWPVTQFQT